MYQSIRYVSIIFLHKIYLPNVPFLRMKNYAFTIAIVVSVVISMAFPHYFTEINGFKLSKLIPPLLQIIMFGMGTTMTMADFTNVAKMPKAVAVGLICQFTIMPTIGFALAYVFSFPPEIAAGIILMGCSPSGLSSNVMSYIAKADVALSITITSIATLLAPILTPLLMKLLAGQFIEVSVDKMMGDIINMIIVPVIAGVFVNWMIRQFSQKWVDIMNRLLPIVSMVGIAFIIVIMTAAGHKALLSIGISLIFAVLVHNTLGYILGYWGGRLFGLNEQSCRTVAIEVGLQNAGLASALALQMGKVATVGLAAALFGPIMNTTGSLLATWWSKKPLK
jgi:bile acid:Na+ symporter, BASS family